MYDVSVKRNHFVFLKALLLGAEGNDTLRGGDGNDRMSGAARDDVIFAAGDGKRDSVSCGAGEDRAVVNLNDVVDGEVVGSVLDAPGQLVGTIGNCERVEVRILQ